MNNWKKLLVRPDDTIETVLRVIDEAASQLALVADAEGKLLGVVTDGNIRRGLLAGQGLCDQVKNVMCATPRFVSPDMRAAAALALMRRKEFSHLPIVDGCGVLVGCWAQKSLQNLVAQGSPVVLMAGGLGSRLGHLTKDCPKPMLHVGGKPLLEVVLQNFIDCGFVHFFFAVNFKAEMIENYFADGTKWGVSIEYLREKKRLGTAGALSLLNNRVTAPFIVMNADILTALRGNTLLEAHVNSGALATMTVIQYDFSVPYGVIKCSSDGRLLQLEEKPIFSHLVSAGVNVLAPETLEYIPRDSFFDMPDLFKLLLAHDKPVHTYLIEDYWLDIGRARDYERANTEFQLYFT